MEQRRDDRARAHHAARRGRRGARTAALSAAQRGVGRPCVGVILAGGRATRYGGAPKGLETLGGMRLIDRVAMALADATDELLLVANAPGSETWLPHVRTVGDVHPDVGSLGGLHAALAHAAPHDVLVVAWDMPLVPAALLRALRARGAEGDVDAVVPRGAQPHDAEPLCAWYAAACSAAADRLITAGERRAGALAGAVRSERIDAGAFGDPAHLFANVNTPDDLSRARRLAGLE